MAKKYNKRNGKTSKRRIKLSKRRIKPSKRIKVGGAMGEAMAMEKAAAGVVDTSKSGKMRMTSPPPDSSPDFPRATAPPLEEGRQVGNMGEALAVGKLPSGRTHPVLGSQSQGVKKIFGIGDKIIIGQPTIIDRIHEYTQSDLDRFPNGHLYKPGTFYDVRIFEKSGKIDTKTIPVNGKEEIYPWLDNLNDYFHPSW